MAKHTKSNFMRGWAYALRFAGIIVLIPGIYFLITNDTYGWVMLLIGAVCLIIARIFSSGYVLVLAAEYYLHDKGDPEFFNKDELKQMRIKNDEGLEYRDPCK